MSAILGLVSGATFSTNSFHNRNSRRRIFHDYPVGMFPLTGLLSLMDSEETDSFEFGWWEKRFQTSETTVAASSSGPTGPNGTTCAVPVGVAAGTTAGATVALAAGTEYVLYVAATTGILVRNQITMIGWPLHVDASLVAQIEDVRGIVTEVGTTYVKFMCSQTTGTLLNSTAAISATKGSRGPVGVQVLITGSAVGEGSLAASTSVYYPPIKPTNYTQIFRDGFSFTRTSMKVPTEFDKTGLYREKAEETLRNHMVQMELAFLFGAKRIDTVTEDGEQVARRQTGGVLWFLEQYEKQYSTYRGGDGSSTGPAAATLITDDAKRILKATDSTVTWAVLNSWIERVFRQTNDKAFEKLILCGSGFLQSFNTYMEGKATLNKNFEAQKVYGMNVVTWETPFGTVHFKTHPLFSRQPSLRYNGLILDVQNLKYRALNDSDTTLLENRQSPSFDGRKDEWMTEAGLEVNFPESCMYIKDLQAITAT